MADCCQVATADISSEELCGCLLANALRANFLKVEISDILESFAHFELKGLRRIPEAGLREGKGSSIAIRSAKPLLYMYFLIAGLAEWPSWRYHVAVRRHHLQ